MAIKHDLHRVFRYQLKATEGSAEGAEENVSCCLGAFIDGTPTSLTFSLKVLFNKPPGAVFSVAAQTAFGAALVAWPDTVTVRERNLAGLAIDQSNTQLVHATTHGACPDHQPISRSAKAAGIVLIRQEPVRQQKYILLIRGFMD